MKRRADRPRGTRVIHSQERRVPPARWRLDLLELPARLREDLERKGQGPRGYLRVLPHSCGPRCGKPLSAGQEACQASRPSSNLSGSMATLKTYYFIGSMPRAALARHKIGSIRLSHGYAARGGWNCPRHRDIRVPLHAGSQLKKSSIIAVKSPPGFAAEPSGSHVFLQQGASAILRIATPSITQ